MADSDTIADLELVILEESYVLSFRRIQSDIYVVMNFLLTDGSVCVGAILFPAITWEDWLTQAGERTRMEALNESAHRYYRRA